MKTLTLGILLFSFTLFGCTEKEPAGKGAPVVASPSKANVGAGKAIAEKQCQACHGLNGGGVAPAIPHLAAQRELYLLASLKEYKEGKRTHAALRDLTKGMSDADMSNLAAYLRLDRHTGIGFDVSDRLNLHRHIFLKRQNDLDRHGRFGFWLFFFWSTGATQQNCDE